jgi:hypothetical protein
MELEAVISELAGLVGDLEPDRWTGADAGRLTELFDRGERLCAAGRALMAARASRCGVWSTAGARSPEDWIAGISGTSRADAQAVLATGEAASGSGGVDRAMRAGDLSARQAQEIAGAIEVDPGAAGRLVEVARQRGLAGLREECRKVRNASADALDDQARAERLRRERGLKYWTDRNGAGRLEGRFAPDSFARFLAVLKPFEREALDDARRDGRREGFDAYRADALLLMAASAVGERLGAAPSCRRPLAARPADEFGPVVECGPSGGSVARGASLFDGMPGAPEPGAPEPGAPEPGAPEPGALEPGDPEPGAPEPGAPESGDPGLGSATGCEGPAPPPPGDPLRRYIQSEVIVVVDYQALVRGHTVGSEDCYIEGVGPIPVAMAHEILGDAFLAGVLKDGVDIRSVVHFGRHPNRMQKTALRVRDPRCVVPGCESTRGLEADHCPEFEKTRHTTLDELAHLCEFHHDQKTHRGAVLSGGPGAWKWTPPPPGPFDDPAPGPFHDPVPGPFDDS